MEQICAVLKVRHLYALNMMKIGNVHLEFVVQVAQRPHVPLMMTMGNASGQSVVLI